MKVSVNVTSMNGLGFLWQREDGNIAIYGFDGLVGKLVRVSLLEGSVVLTCDEDEIPPEECIPFTEDTLSCPTAIDYFKQNDALCCLFVQIFGIYTQCSGMKIVEIKPS